MSESNINVAVKMRPLIKREIDKKIPSCWKKNGQMLVDTVTGTNEFAFDLIFDEESTTRELYDKVARPIVSSALAGVNGTVFAYGQTSSGKTHTMMGDEENDGLMLMAIKHIFNEVESSNIEFVLRVGFIELYNEKVYDLYDPDNVDLKMVEKNNDAYVNCKEAICKSVEDMYNVIKIGNKNKKIGDTYMNDRSSRSHTIFRISIESIDAVSEKAKISNLNLVDLAGSERASQTGATGARFVEGSHINKSLLSLSKVVNKLINNDNCHINYRDSKLTRYLQSSLGGNAMAAIICTLCPTALDETISTLYFAQRAMKVTNKPRVNEIISDATMIKQLHNQIKTLKVELEKAKSEANSAVPGIMKELMLHQGQILNYRKAETKAKLRRRTWTTFDNELAVISESAALVLNPQQTSMSDLRCDTIKAPLINMVNSDRGIGEFDYDPTKDLDKICDEFDYKSKYQKLLHDYDELQEFTNWENKLEIEPDVETDYKNQIVALEEEVVMLKQALENSEKLNDPTAYKDQISVLEKEHAQMKYSLQLAQQEKDSVEYLYEQHQKKAEQREKDLLSMLEDMKASELVRANVEEKNFMIQELQDQMKELSRLNDELQQKASEHGDVEQRVMKLEKVEVELEELKNTITVLTNTILTLENEKKEMSIRFNESMSVSTYEMTQSMVSSQPNPELAASVAGDVSKLQTENDELSSKVMDLIEENDELKQRIQEVSEKLSTTEREEAAKLEELKKLIEEKTVDYEKHIKMLQENVDELHCDLSEAKAQLKDSEDSVHALQDKLKANDIDFSHLQEKLSAALSKVESLEQQLQERSRQLEDASNLTKELEERENTLRQQLTTQGNEFKYMEEKMAQENQLMQQNIYEQCVKLEQQQKDYDATVNKSSEAQQEFSEKMRDLEETVQKVKSESSEKMQCLYEENASLKERISQLVVEMQHVVADKDAKTSELVQEKAILQEKMHRLTEELDLKSAESVSRSSLNSEEKIQLQVEIDRVNTELSCKLEEFNEKWQAVEEQKSQLQEEINRLNGELQQCSEGSKAQIEGLIEEKKELQGEIHRLNGDLQLHSDESQSKIANLSLEIKDLQQEIDRLNSELQLRGEDYETKIAQVLMEKEHLKQELDSELQVKSEKNQSKINELLEENDRLQKEIERLNGDVEQHNEECQSKIAALIEEKKNLLKQIDRLGEDFASKLEEKEAYATEMFKENDRLKNEIKIFNGLNQEENQLKLAELYEEKRTLKEDYDKKCEELITSNRLQEEAAEIMRKESEEKLDSVTKMLESRNVESLEKVNVLTAEMERLSKELEAKESAVKFAVEEVEKRLNDQLDVQLQKVHTLSKDLSAVRAHVQELESLLQEKDNMISALEPLKAEIEMKNQKISELEGLLESEVDSVKCALEEKIKTITGEKGELEGLKESLAAKEQRIGELQQDLARFENQHREKVDQLERESRIAKEEICSKNDKIEELMKQMNAMERIVDEKTTEVLEAKAALAELSEKQKKIEEALAESDSKRQQAVGAYEAEKEKLQEEVRMLTGQQAVAEKRFEEFGRQLRIMETQKEELAAKLKSVTDECDHLKGSLEVATKKRSAAEEQMRDLNHKHGILKSRIESLEQELSQKDVALNEVQMQMQNTGKSHGGGGDIDQHEEEVAKLQAHIKRLRVELTDLQKKEPRKQKRSSVFDSNRHLIGAQMTVETQTDPVNELCQCEALNIKVNELKKSNMLKDMQMVQLKEAETRSPMLLENYTLKKRLVAAKEAEANHAKEMVKMEERLYQAVKQASQCKKCDNRKQFTVACQTMPDMNLETIADLQAQLNMQRNKYGEMKEVVMRQQQKIKRMEEEMAEPPEPKRGAENNPNQANQPSYVQLRSKYEMVKTVVEKRYYKIIQLQKDLEDLRNQRTCVKCRTPINSLQVP